MTEKKDSKNTWATQDAGRNVFWAKAKDLGFDNDGVHAALGVESIYDLEMQLTEALVALERAAKDPVTNEPDAERDEPEQEQAEIDLSDLATLPEAPASINFFTVSTSGLNVQWTLRDVDERRLYQRFTRMANGLIKAGHFPTNRYGDILPTISKEAQEKARREQPAAKPQAQAPTKAPTPQPAAGNAPSALQSGGDSKSGTAPLNKITVDADGRVEFHVGRFRWPFKDGRGAEVVAGLFDQALGWTPGHFAPGAKYEGETVAGLVVDWEKPDKYYNVIRIHL